MQKTETYVNCLRSIVLIMIQFHRKGFNSKFETLFQPSGHVLQIHGTGKAKGDCFKNSTSLFSKNVKITQIFNEGVLALYLHFCYICKVAKCFCVINKSDPFYIVKKRQHSNGTPLENKESGVFEAIPVLTSCAINFQTLVRLVKTRS